MIRKAQKYILFNNYYPKFIRISYTSNTSHGSLLLSNAPNISAFLALMLRFDNPKIFSINIDNESIINPRVPRLHGALLIYYLLLSITHHIKIRK